MSGRHKRLRQQIEALGIEILPEGESLPENTRVACVRVVDESLPVPGSVPRTCAGGCGYEVWISKATRESTDGAPTWCLQCLMADVEASIAGDS